MKTDRKTSAVNKPQRSPTASNGEGGRLSIEERVAKLEHWAQSRNSSPLARPQPASDDAPAAQAA